MVRAHVTYFSGEIPQGNPEGDQREIFRKFQLLSKDKNYPVLNSFLDSVTSALKDEVRNLGRTQRELMPYFERVIDLTDHVVQLRKTSLGGAVERVLVIVLQLGTFISYYEAHPDEYDFKAGNACILSRGTGLLSSAAVGLSPRLGDIPRVAEDVTRIAFRFGLVVDEVSRTLEFSPAEINATGAWIQCCYGLGETEAVEEVARFNKEMNYPETTKATVFNVDSNSISVSGPPSTIKTLFAQSLLFKNARSVPLQKIQGCWHAEHIYGPEHVQYMIPDDCVKGRKLHFPVFSPVTGESFQADNTKDFFRQLMEEIMMKRVYWDSAVYGALSYLKSLHATSVNMTLLRPSYYITDMLEDWKVQIPGLVVSTTETIPWVVEHATEERRPRDDKSCKLAVVGMSCRFPDGADSNEKFWELLEQGRDAHRPVPSNRFNVETHVDPEGKKPNTTRTPYGCFINQPGLFDAPFFNMSPREAEQTDPMHRLALVTAYEALEQAGFVQGRGVHKRKVGTFYGQASDDYREVNSGQDIGTYFIPGGCRAFAPGRINYFFNFWGPSFSVDTACSSSLAAIQQACTSLWSGDSDMVIAGGLNVITNSDVSAGLSNGHFLSKTGGCKTWDIGADGYCRADGVGSVVLKRLEDAEADNDNIMAVVLSAATDHSAEAVSITHPHDLAQASLYTQVSRRAGIDPLDVSYVEMHGTGTQAGDNTEVKSVTDVFAPASRPRGPDNPLHIGTVKSNVGHGEAAAGIMAFVKACLVFQKSAIPPHVGVKTQVNPSLPDLPSKNVLIPFKKTPWPRPASGKPRVMVVNNFGAAGGNTTVVLEDAPIRNNPATLEDSRTLHILPLSAKNRNSLRGQIDNLISYLTTNPEVSLADLSYTLSARRAHYPFRVAIGATSAEHARKQLAPLAEKCGDHKAVGKEEKQVVFTFTGQGAFYLGIGKELYQDCAYFRRQVVQLDGLARRQGFPSFLGIVDGTWMGEEKDVGTTEMHLAIVCVEVALARLWRQEYGVKVGAVVGHSLGEYAALVTAGVLSESGGIFLVGTRARLLDAKCKAGTHSMMAVRGSVAEIEDLSGGLKYQVACINSQSETVLAGPMEELNAMCEVLAKAGRKTHHLGIAHAYHSDQMNAVVDDFVEQARGVVFKTPQVPIISPLHAKVFTTEDVVDARYLAEGTRHTVNFVGALESAWETGVVGESTCWLEVGPHPICSRFVQNGLPSSPSAFPSLRKKENNWTTMAQAMCGLHNLGVEVDWDAFHKPFEGNLRVLPDLPSYAWNNRDYWIQYRGDWNLTKGREIASQPAAPAAGIKGGFSTSAVHAITSEDFSGSKVTLRAEVDVNSAVLREAVDGHAMNNYGCVSSFMHADMAFTLAKYVHDKLQPGTEVGINVSDFEYHEPVVRVQMDNVAQVLQMACEADLKTGTGHVQWYNPDKDLWYTHASFQYEGSSAWLSEWSRYAHLVSGRVDALRQMAAAGTASKVTKDLAYRLFGNLVGYGKSYQNMQSVILNDFEAMAEVTFPSDAGGVWTVPPHFIDGVISLSGFILNGGDCVDNKNNFYVTPSWKSMRFARPLTPGGKYIAYVKMLPHHDGTPNAYSGDVYVLDATTGEITAVVESILFRGWPRILLNRFFSPPKKLPGSTTKPTVATIIPAAPAPPKKTTTTTAAPEIIAPKPTKPLTLFPPSANLTVTATSITSAPSTPASTPPPANSSSSPSPKAKPAGAAATKEGSKIARAMAVIAEETAVDAGALTDDAEIVELGLDSLMSLVIAQKVREELGIEIRDSFFLEVSTIGDLKGLLVG